MSRFKRLVRSSGARVTAISSRSRYTKSSLDDAVLLRGFARELSLTPSARSGVAGLARREVDPFEQSLARTADRHRRAADAVLLGRVIAGRPMRLACQRHPDHLDSQPSVGMLHARLDHPEASKRVRGRRPVGTPGLARRPAAVRLIELDA
jgi:hypothetical protein